ncbi:MAG TPA: putative sulfate exporter family transporter [Tepidisphaeraceae bacterium]|nr:putative sulfate exporter family transporter [Tepidisphaeraceae bacterium]
MTDVAEIILKSRPADATEPESRPEPRWVKESLFLLVAAACLTGYISPPIALAIGIVLALSAGNPFKNTGKIAKFLLQFCVIMLGFTMNLPTVLKAGASGAVFAAATISTTLLLGWLIGKLLRTGKLTSLLISTGTAICGGSAIAAVGSVVDAPDGEMSVAMGTVFTLNAIALVLFPLVGHMLNLSQHQFGIWAGVAIHDISSVFGAAVSYDHSFGPKALLAQQTAMAVKLSRTLWIVPVAITVAAFEHRKHRRADGTSHKKSIQIPWFIGLFVLASVISSYVPHLIHIPGLAHIQYGISFVAKVGLTLTLFLIGAGLSMKTLRAVGWRALVQGVVVWTFISISSLMVIIHMH